MCANRTNKLTGTDDAIFVSFLKPQHGFDVDIYPDPVTEILRDFALVYGRQCFNLLEPFFPLKSAQKASDTCSSQFTVFKCAYFCQYGTIISINSRW